MFFFVPVLDCAIQVLVVEFPFLKVVCCTHTVQIRVQLYITGQYMCSIILWFLSPLLSCSLLRFSYVELNHCEVFHITNSYSLPASLNSSMIFIF